MNHPAELALHRYMDNAANGKSTMSEDTIKQVGKDVMDALARQFGESGKRDFRLRMSNIGRPTCQLWFDKNKPETALASSNHLCHEHDAWRYCGSSIQRATERSRS